MGKTARGNATKKIYGRNATSIYFLLWAVFSAFALFIVVLLAVSQHVLTVQTYKSVAAKEISQSGQQVESDIEKGLTAGIRDMNELFRLLGVKYDAKVFWLNGDGDVLYPELSVSDSAEGNAEEYLAFREEIVVLQKKLTEAEKGGHTFAVYESEGNFVYASKMRFKGGVETYLYVGKSIDIMETGASQMVVRTVLIGVFVLILAFAISSAVAGWLVNPLSEITKKAKRLAHGDFNVDFYGTNYGEEIIELADSLNFARDEISKADRMQKELIANVSHDFKTPLTMIKAYASMIMEISGDIPEKRNKHAQVIVSEADRLTSLVADVLDLSKIRSGIEVLKPTLVDMSSYLQEILDRFDCFKEEQGYTFVTQVEEGLYAYVDELKIGQALYNLVGNAVNYTGEDKTVYVTLKKETEETFRFEVRDTGSGMKAEEMPEIWDRYYRSAETHKRPVKGTGLGLSIVKTILQKHGLDFGVESERGKGSTFYIVFPVVPEEAETQEKTE
ncbi:MAG: HAMP domain-containing histidine kinase [Clostridia bacterium]|nr:HAMP domain-containing histidine kinase [Clostridia bacterium]